MSPIILLALQQTPALIALFKDLFHKHNPTEPVPTEADIFAAFEAAFASSLAVDDNWIAVHPNPTP